MSLGDSRASKHSDSEHSDSSSEHSDYEPSDPSSEHSSSEHSSSEHSSSEYSYSESESEHSSYSYSDSESSSDGDSSSSTSSSSTSSSSTSPASPASPSTVAGGEMNDHSSSEHSFSGGEMNDFYGGEINDFYGGEINDLYGGEMNELYGKIRNGISQAENIVRDIQTELTGGANDKTGGANVKKPILLRKCPAGWRTCDILQGCPTGSDTDPTIFNRKMQRCYPEAAFVETKGDQFRVTEREVTALIAVALKKLRNFKHEDVNRISDLQQRQRVCEYLKGTYSNESCEAKRFI